MKKIMKRPVLLIFTALMILMLCSCGKEKDDTEYNETTVNQITKNVVALMQNSVNPSMAEKIAKADEEDLEAFENEIASMGLSIKGDAFQNGYGSYTTAVNGDLGEIVKVDDSAVVTANDGTITSDIKVTGTKTFPDGSPRTATVEILMTRRGTVTSVTYNVDRTFGEKITNAGLNTVLGMGTTFCLLIFISIVIWIMGTVVQNMENSKKERLAEKERTTDQVVDQIAAREEQAKSAPAASDDSALIAVISAAIAAYESEARGVNVSPDTFVVRSLRRR